MNSNSLYVPGVTSTATTVEAPAESGRSSRYGPDSSSSQPSVPPVQPEGMSERFNSTSRTTIRTWLMTSVSLPLPKETGASAIPGAALTAAVAGRVATLNCACEPVLPGVDESQAARAPARVRTLAIRSGNDMWYLRNRDRDCSIALHGPW